MPAILLVHLKVQDQEKWRQTFEANIELRKSHGCTGTHIFYNAHDQNEIIVNLQWESEEQAQAFLSSPEFKQAQEQAGVVGAPRFWFLADGGRTPS